MDHKVERILDMLQAKKLRATYEAVATFLGVPPRSLGIQLGQRCPRGSWVVSAKTGDPTGYAPDEIHPDLKCQMRIIGTADELRLEMLDVAEDEVAPVSLLDHLRLFNSKERFFLVGQALDNPRFTPGREFRAEMSNALGLRLPDEPFCAMDYHLDWLYASLQLNADGGEKRVYPNATGIIKAQQEDVDLLIGYEDKGTTHIIIVEAKGVTGWTNSQMQSKAARLMDIFGDDGRRWANVIPHFILMSPRESKGLKVSDWPKWMAPDGLVSWMSLRVPRDLKRVSRCEQDGALSAGGKFWTIANR